jgi:hypothetical protein
MLIGERTHFRLFVCCWHIRSSIRGIFFYLEGIISAHLLIGFMGFMINAKEDIISSYGNCLLMCLIVCRLLHLLMIEFCVCMVGYHHSCNLWNRSKKYRNLLMYLIVGYFVICCGVIRIRKRMDGVRMKEELVLHLGLSMWGYFVRSKI